MQNSTCTRLALEYSRVAEQSNASFPLNDVYLVVGTVSVLFSIWEEGCREREKVSFVFIGRRRTDGNRYWTSIITLNHDRNSNKVCRMAMEKRQHFLKYLIG